MEYKILFSSDAQKDLKTLQKKVPQALPKLAKLLDELREHPRTGKLIYRILNNIDTVTYVKRKHRCTLIFARREWQSVTRYLTKVAANSQKLLPLRCYKMLHAVHRRFTSTPLPPLKLRAASGEAARRFMGIASVWMQDVLLNINYSSLSTARTEHPLLRSLLITN